MSNYIAVFSMQFAWALVTVSTLLMSLPAAASSHREAPSIAQDPAADITDFYIFKPSGDRRDTHVVFVLNVYPGQLAASGPNWYRFGEEVRYKIQVDNDGDAEADLVYSFNFGTRKTRSELPLAYPPGIKFEGKRYTSELSQTYNVSIYNRKRGKKYRLRTAFAIPVAPARVGPFTTDIADASNPLDFASPTKTDPRLADRKYTELAMRAVRNAGPYRFFAGPRNDPFFVDLGGVFDGLSIRVPGLSGTPKDALAGKNVLSIVMEAPIEHLVKEGGPPIFGAWASTHRRQFTVRRAADPRHFGGGVQVARLGNPLVNEVVIGIRDKDRFNRSMPASDVDNFAKYVTDPSLAVLLNNLYSKSKGAIAKLLEPIEEKNRQDLVAAFVTGIPGVNQIPGAKGSGDMLRINLDLPISWPNGRTLKDDVVKTALVVLAQCKVDLFGKLTIGKYDSSTVNCALDDGIGKDDLTLGGTGQTDSFPYLGIPHSSYGERGAIQ